MLILQFKTGDGTGWDIENGSYASKSFSIISQEGTPKDVYFKDDGLKMYVLGHGNDDVFQYTLSTAWDVTSASYDTVLKDVGAQDASPSGLYIKSDGLQFFTAGSTTSTIYQYSMSSAWDMSTGSYASKSFSVSSQTTALQDVSFSSDGTKMYVVGDSNNSVFQYTLSSAWDVSTASYDSKSFNFGSQDTNPEGIIFKDGTTMFMTGSSSDAVHQYTLSTAWDVSTASYDSILLSVAGQTSAPRDVTFSSTGKNMYIMAVNGNVYQYNT